MTPLEHYERLQLRRDYLQALFWSKVDVVEASACWEWQASESGPMGYGKFFLDRETPIGAHRVSWMLAHGPVPEGLHVCHYCDNPPCVNPAHLFVGTAAENFDDMVSKGRFVFGARKLTPEGAEAIRSGAMKDAPARALAKRLGVHITTIHRVRRGSTWTGKIRRVS